MWLTAAAYKLDGSTMAKRPDSPTLVVPVHKASPNDSQPAASQTNANGDSSKVAAGAAVHPNQAPGQTPSQSLSPEMQAQLLAAKLGRKSINTGLLVAGFNAWSYAVFAALSALFMAFSFSMLGLFLTVGLGGVAWFEFKGRAQLKALDDEGPKTLVSNQWLLLFVLAMYFGYQVFVSATGDLPLLDEFAADPMVADMMADIAQDLERRLRPVLVGTYVVLLLGAIVWQLAVVWYYRKLGKQLVAYKQNTPEWIVQVQAQGL